MRAIVLMLAFVAACSGKDPSDPLAGDGNLDSGVGGDAPVDSPIDDADTTDATAEAGADVVDDLPPSDAAPEADLGADAATEDARDDVVSSDTVGDDRAVDQASDPDHDAPDGSDLDAEMDAPVETDSGTDPDTADADIDLSLGLVAHYPFDGSASDASGNAHHGIVNGASPAEDRFGVASSAYAFNGTSDRIDVADAPGLRLTGTLSISVWVQRTRTDIDIVLEKGGDWNTEQAGEANYGLGLHTINDSMFYFFFAGGWRGTTGVSDTDWHHYVVVATHGQADPALYIDNVPQPIEYQAGVGSINLNPSVRDLHIGAQLNPGFDYFSANVIDDVRIYDRALNADEIGALYAEGL